MTQPTKADLTAAVARLTQENAALRDLLTAVRAYADLPHPADYNSRTYEYELERRADAIAIWANGDQRDLAPDVYVLVIQDRAKYLCEEAAKPVRYEVRAEPAPAEVLAESITSGTPVTVAVAELVDRPDEADGFASAELGRSLA